MLSVFTPSHDTRHLDECYRSLASQTLDDWEWIVLLNGRARNWQPPVEDARVRVERAIGNVRGVGALKRAACELATGDLLVELDHDDLLLPGCLEKVRARFDSDQHVVLVYSDFAQINGDGSPNSERFDETNGWVYTDVEIDGVAHLRCHAMAPTPHNVSYIWYAPNHVRAFRRSAYEQIGGYDAAVPVLDDQDLMMRLFRVGDFAHLPECLYLQRRHARNTQSVPSTNAVIQDQTVIRYEEGIRPLAQAWSRRRGLASVALRTPTTVGEPPLSAPDVQLHLLRPSQPKPYLSGWRETPGSYRASPLVGRNRSHDLDQQ